MYYTCLTLSRKYVHTNLMHFIWRSYISHPSRKEPCVQCTLIAGEYFAVYRFRRYTAFATKLHVHVSGSVLVWLYWFIMVILKGGERVAINGDCKEGNILPWERNRPQISFLYPTFLRAWKVHVYILERSRVDYINKKYVLYNHMYIKSPLILTFIYY